MAEYMQNEFVIYDNIEGYAEWSKEQEFENALTALESELNKQLDELERSFNS